MASIDPEIEFVAELLRREKMIEVLTESILPRTLMSCVHAWRSENYKEAIKGITEATLSWLLYLINRYRSSAEYRTDDLLEAFDPSMYFHSENPAWEGPPGTVIELPELTSEIVASAERGTELAKTAREEIREFRDHADTWSDEELMQLGNIAKAGLADQVRVFQCREEVIRYVALNSSARIEDLRLADESAWLNAPLRRIEFPDMVARVKEQMLSGELAPPLKETDYVCFSDDEVRKFACNLESMFLCERVRHLEVCTKCQQRLEAWFKIIGDLDKQALNKQGLPDA